MANPIVGTQSKWLVEQEEYISWHTNPDNVGKDIGLWADDHKIPRATVYGWNIDKGMKARMLEYFNENYRKQEVAVVSALINKAKTGDTAALKLYLQYVNQWSERTEQAVTATISVDADAVMRLVKEKLDATKPSAK